MSRHGHVHQTRRTATITVLAALAALLAGAILRSLEAPAWSEPVLWTSGVPLLPSFDAYAWVAGAEGSGRLAGWPMAGLLQGLAALTGQPPVLVAFWLPVALAPLPGVIVALFCASRGLPWAGLPGGIMAGSGLGYLLRTRLGYADTELFALAMAVALAAAWCLAAEGLARKRDREIGDWQVAPTRDGWGWVVASAAGLWLYLQLYPSGYPIAVAVLGAGALSGMWLAGRDGAGRVIWALAAVLAAGHFGWAGPAMAVALIGVGGRRLAPGGIWPAAGVLVLVAAGVAWLHGDLWQNVVGRVAAYAGWSPEAAVAGNWRLPDLRDAILETGVVDVRELLARAGTHWTFALAGLAGFLGAVIRWPGLMVFLPLGLLGLGGYWLGHRFALYAVPVVGLGLGLGLALLLERLRPLPLAGAIAQVAMATGIMVLLAWHATQFSARPALNPGHARALASLEERAESDGRVWDWWDFGYAAQHFAELPTLADGGSTTRERLFALGQVFGAASPRQAAQVMKLAALTRSAVSGGTAPPTWSDFYGPRPLGALSGDPAEAAQARLDGLTAEPGQWPSDLPAEYLVVSWQTLRRAEWVSRFGRWRLDRGSQGHGQSMTLQPPVDLDRRRGVLETRDGPLPLATLDILEGGERFHRSWPNRGVHAVINNDNGEGVLLDDGIYGMTAVQMLIAEPGRFVPYFDLVVDEFPAARVYRVE